MNLPAMEYRKLADLKAHPKNPRIHPDSAIAKLETSINEYGFQHPIIINKDGTVLGGHARCKVAAKLNMLEVPCIVLDLSDDDALGYLIADNRLAEDTFWDNILLVDLFKELKAHDFNMDATAFDDEEITDLLGIMDERSIIDDGFDYNSKPTETVAENGDIWQLGRHKLIVGEPTASAFEKLMQGNKANVAITTDDKEFRQQMLNGAYNNLADGGAFYYLYEILDSLPVSVAIKSAGFHYAETCSIKTKGKATKCKYKNSYTPIAYGFKNTSKHKWYSDRKQTTIWDSKTPLEIYGYSIQNSSAPNGIVLDPNAKYGDALIVCEQKDRTFYGIANVNDANLIIERFKKFSKAEVRKL